jgi:hypothetical protein
VRRYENSKCALIPRSAAEGFGVWQGQERKRLIKLARRQFTADQLRDMVQPSPDAHPVYCVVRFHGYDLLRAWGQPHGLYEVTIEDDVRAFAIVQHLKERGMVFESDEAASEYGRARGLAGGPQDADPGAAPDRRST